MEPGVVEIGNKLGFAGGLVLAMGFWELMSKGGFSAWMYENILSKSEVMIGAGLVAIVTAGLLMKLGSNSGQTGSE